VSAVLKGTAPWPSAEKPGDLAFGGRLRFRPGVLSLNSTESFRHCYVDPHSYGGHFLHSHGRIGVSISEENKLIYILVSCACARLCSHGVLRASDGSLKRAQSAHARAHARLTLSRSDGCLTIDVFFPSSCAPSLSFTTPAAGQVGLVDSKGSHGLLERKRVRSEHQ
jgi:hypothetical protein